MYEGHGCAVMTMLSTAQAQDTCARRPIQQDTLGRLDAQVLEPLLMRDRQHNCLHQLLYLLV